jgi:hypothetical protein
MSCGVLFLGYCVGLTLLLMQKIGGSRMAIIDWPIGILYAFVGGGFAMMAWRAVDVAVVNWRRRVSVLERPELQDESAEASTLPRIPLRTLLVRGPVVVAVIAAAAAAMSYLGSYVPALRGSIAIGFWCIAAICLAHWALRQGPAPRSEGSA